MVFGFPGCGQDGDRRLRLAQWPTPIFVIIFYDKSEGVKEEYFARESLAKIIIKYLNIQNLILYKPS